MLGFHIQCPEGMRIMMFQLSGFYFKGLGLRGLGFGVEGRGFRVYGLELRLFRVCWMGFLGLWGKLEV